MPTAPPPTTLTWLRWLVFGGLVGGLLWGCVQVALDTVAQQQQRPLTALEFRYLELVEATRADWHPDFSQGFSEPLKKWAPHRTDGVAQPLWPWLLAGWVNAADPAVLLKQAGLFRVGGLLGGLLVLAFAWRRWLSLPATLLALLLAAFDGMIPQLAPFSGALLFGFFFLFTWMACLEALRRNSLWWYGLIGGLGGLAYLAEDRVLPLLAVFIGVSTLRAFWGWLVAQGGEESGTTLWVRRNHGFGLLLLVSVFGAMAGPRLVEAHRQFGQPWISHVDQVRWLENREEAEAWLTQSEIAEKAAASWSWASYRLDHEPEAIWQRWQTGLVEVLRRLWQQGGGLLAGEGLALLGLLIAVRLGAPKASHAWQRLHPETASTVLFFVLAVWVYVTIAAWDAAVGMLDHLPALTAPVAFGLLSGGEGVLCRARRRDAPLWIARTYLVVLWLLVFLGAARVWLKFSPALTL